MKICEIFTSIDGESRRAGELATFIRSVGCNLRCSYCDSAYSWIEDSSDKEMDVEEIVRKCKKLGVHNITFTGGEPLIQIDADKLINRLSEEGFDVGIETDGAVDFTERSRFKKDLKNVWVCADYKCYESGMNHRMIPLEKFAQLRERDVIKFVVGSKDDLLLAKETIEKLKEKGCEATYYLSPVFGKIKPVAIVNFMLENKMQDKIRFQLQIHKFVWDPQKRGV